MPGWSHEHICIRGISCQFISFPVLGLIARHICIDKDVLRDRKRQYQWQKEVFAFFVISEGCVSKFWHFPTGLGWLTNEAEAGGAGVIRGVCPDPKVLTHSQEFGWLPLGEKEPEGADPRWLSLPSQPGATLLGQDKYIHGPATVFTSTTLPWFRLG